MDDAQGFRLRGVSVRAGASVLLDALELDLPRAAWSAVIGPSGSGKTTLLRLLNRLSEPSAGTIAWRGAPLASFEVRGLRREVGLVVQQPRLQPGTVRSNLELCVRLGAIDAASARGRLAGACGVAQLPDALLDRDVSSISGGERQRVALARALLLEPQVLLLDEPTAALDRETARRMLAALDELRTTRGLTLIAVTHRAEELRELAALYVVLAQGRVLEQGAPERVLECPTHALTRELLGLRES